MCPKHDTLEKNIGSPSGFGENQDFQKIITLMFFVVENRDFLRNQRVIDFFLSASCLGPSGGILRFFWAPEAKL